MLDVLCVDLCFQRRTLQRLSPPEAPLIGATIGGELRWVRPGQGLSLQCEVCTLARPGQARLKQVAHTQCLGARLHSPPLSCAAHRHSKRLSSDARHYCSFTACILLEHPCDILLQEQSGDQHAALLSFLLHPISTPPFFCFLAFSSLTFFLLCISHRVLHLWYPRPRLTELSQTLAVIYLCPHFEANKQATRLHEGATKTS